MAKRYTLDDAHLGKVEFRRLDPRQLHVAAVNAKTDRTPVVGASNEVERYLARLAGQLLRLCLVDPDLKARLSLDGREDFEPSPADAEAMKRLADAVLELHGMGA